MGWTMIHCGGCGEFVTWPFSFTPDSLKYIICNPITRHLYVLDQYIKSKSEDVINDIVPSFI
jgi:hypothetical protein